MRLTILFTICTFLIFSFKGEAQNSTSISYSGTPYCNSGFATVTRNGDSLRAKYAAIPIGLVIDSLTGTIDLSKSIPKTYTVIYTVNCLLTQCTYTATVTIHSTDATIRYTSDTFCRAVVPPVESIILDGTGSITGGIYNSTPVGLLINSNTGDITPYLSSYGTYEVVYTYKDTICGTFHDTTNVTIVDKVTPKITIVATADTICLGTSISFTAMPINGGTAPTYQWYKNGLLIIDSSNVTLNYTHH